MSKKLRNSLVTGSVMVLGPLALALGDASLTIFPDYGAWRGASRIGQQGTGQEVRLTSLAPTSTQVGEEEGAAALRERQLKAKLEALGIAVD